MPPQELQPINVQLVNDSKLYLDYTIYNIGGGGVGKVDIWYTRDKKALLIRPGDRFYVVAHGRLRGWAPVTRIGLPPHDDWTHWAICRRGGAVFILPDCVRETFTPSTGEGGHDGTDGRGMRYVEWVFDPDPADATYVAAYGFLMREADGTLHCDMDRHEEGLFARAAWLEWLREGGFDPSTSLDPFNRDVFVGRR